MSQEVNAIVEKYKAEAIKLAKQMALEMVEVAAIPALEDAAKKSATPVDDLIVAALKEPLKQTLKELISKA